LGSLQLFRRHVPELARKRMYFASAAMILIGVLAMRWNVVIGGQLFSKSFLGYTTYKLDFATREGLLPAIIILLLPFLILWVLVKLLPPWEHERPTA
jgi:predicted membrane protein